MLFEEYCNNIWKDNHKLYYSLESRMKKTEIDRLDLVCLQRVDWLEYCINNGCKEDVTASEVEKAFLLMIDYCQKCAKGESLREESFRTVGGIIQCFFQLILEGEISDSDNVVDMDTQLIEEINETMGDIFSSRKLPFETCLAKTLSWYRFRKSTYQQGYFGYSPLDCHILFFFERDFRDEIVNCRNAEFVPLYELGGHAVWIYNESKQVPREAMFGDIQKVNRLAIQCCRDALVAAKNNGFFEFEEAIKTEIRSIQSDILSTPTLFISYNWGKEELVDKIQNEVNKFAIVKRDKNELGFGDSITDFMNTIRQEDFALVVLSDAYLKSDACMYELTTLFQEKGKNGFDHKVMFVVCEDARTVYSSCGRASYVEFWENRYNELVEKSKVVSAESGVEISQSIRTVSFIRLQIGEFLEYAKSVNNFSETDAVKEIKNFISQATCETKIGRNLFEEMILYVRNRKNASVKE